MLNRLLSSIFLVSAPMLFGQLDSNSVTVTTTQSLNLQPDQILFAVGVTTPITATLDDVLAAVKSVGLTSSNFTGLNSTLSEVQPPGSGTAGSPNIVQWSFGLAVPFAQSKATITALTALQQSIVQNNPGFLLTFNLQGTQVSAALRQEQGCNLTSLIADATTQAQKLASAAGLNLGSILAMSSAPPTSVPAPASGIAVGGFVGLLSPTVTQTNCALTLKFGLTRF
ncbi:MAG TPA: SIMPL domain-containing protein [Bryobacteraceae bacterium]|nr:SIMPL domain-containing protein [Bryobacteraceae bacterium]